MSLLREAQRCLANQAARKSLNAFITLPDTAAVLRQVQSAESQTSQPSPLNGRLVAIKDNICTTDSPTTCASAILRTFTSPYDATVIQRLRAAGAVVAGKTNLDEFGMGSHNLNSHFGPVSQSESVSAGGSSGGSAVAVATDQCWAALGTDTGGSVRLPAAYTGIVGFKPSYGLVSRWGVVAYANSLDTVGVMARDSKTAKDVFNAINHHDPLDPTSLAPSTRSRLPRTPPNPGPLRVGVPTDYNITELTPAVRRAWKRTLAHLQSLGHTIVPVALPTTHQALSAYYVLAPAEASSNLAKYDGVRYGTRAEGADGSADAILFSKTRGAGFGDEVKRRIVLGAYTLSAEAMDNYFIQAQRVRRLVQRDFDRCFRMANPLLVEERDNSNGDIGATDEGVDVLICPTAPTLPPRVEELREAQPVDAYMNDVFTVPASLAGLPAMSVPVGGEEEGRKVGMQVIAQYGCDELVFEVAGMIEGN
ncbi:Glutamyl-tRNA(Gln) amidotransferase subunit A [Lasiodiplodia theobromae]|uniref:Glutamyl-tRNA(Gln) amidotransferase subunit A, mitochondrial n=1 Tax=Lasiodiplodia theobromae TaxID=45133 RepID=A0A5N5DHP9_9PEZI|nr:Glutamyl-tRNA(Gln) amidotransferase subunit A [Lasiodiplodia theobromae]